MALVYGIHAVFESLRGESAKVERICIQRGLGSPRLQEIIDAARAKKVPISFEPKSWLDRKTDGGRHQGILCFTAEMEILGVETILGQAASPGLLLILDGIEDTRNVGAILRSAEVAGADGVLMPQRRSAPLGASAVKASGGAASHIRVTRVPNIPRLIEELKKRGYWVAGLEAGAGNPLWSADFTVPTALVFGSEGRGLRPLVREKCDFLLGIPVRGRISSYNVSVAAGIALYEVIRQRSLTAGK